MRLLSMLHVFDILDGTLRKADKVVVDHLSDEIES